MEEATQNKDRQALSLSKRDSNECPASGSCDEDRHRDKRPRHEITNVTQSHNLATSNRSSTPKSPPQVDVASTESEPTPKVRQGEKRVESHVSMCTSSQQIQENATACLAGHDGSSMSRSSQRVEILYCLKVTDENDLERTFYQDRPWADLSDSLPTPREDETIDTGATAPILVHYASASVEDKTSIKGNTITTWRDCPVDFQFGRDAHLVDRGRVNIRLYSKPLINIMKSLLDYYPSHLEGYELYEANQDHMFPEFMYYYAELKVYLQKLLQTEFEGRSIPSEFSIGSCGDEEIFAALQQHLDFGTLNSAGEACDKAAAYDLAVLLRYLAPMYRVNIVPTLTSVLLHESPLIRYDKLWLLFRPGTYVYFRQSINDTTLSGAVVAQSFYESYSRPASIVRRNIESTARLVLDLWIVRHNNESFQLVHNNFSINRFEGPRHVKALHVVPADLHDKFDQGATREKLEKRGRKYLSILSEPAPYAYRNYDHPRSGVCGKIIVDEETYMRYSTPKPPPGPHPGPHSGAPAGPYRGPPPPQGPPATEDDSGGGRFRDLLAFTPSSSKDYHRIKEVYPLLPRYVRGLELKSKNWMTFEVDYISDSAPAAPPNQLDSELVLVFDADKEALRTVLKNGEKNLTVPSDFVPGKGEGKIFLLYGPPGTGKTLTVECIANDTGRPLISLGVHNIGQITEDIENRLRNWFTLAARWNAILLIDEADIFLEQRQEGNYGRNSLSTIFLRTMEYYKGVLFLTTNRPGHIDDSFISRITCPILYQELSLETKAKIINRFLRKFEENGDIEVENAAKSYLVSHCQKLNGRQIRNVLQDALAASEVKHRADKLFDSQHEPARLVEEGSQIVKVKISYVKAAVERQLQFLGYQDELRQRPEALRAKSKHDYLLVPSK